MAAEIASALAVGGKCPVCGSCDHPHRRVPPGAPDLAEEKAARKRVDTADIIRQAHEDRVRDLGTRWRSPGHRQARRTGKGSQPSWRPLDPRPIDWRTWSQVSAKPE